MSRIFIGVGHGGMDPGAIGLDGIICEKDIALQVAKDLRKLLIAEGHEVVISRFDDESMTVNDRVKKCNSDVSGFDLAVDIHFNAGGGTGFECYRSVYSGEGTIGYKVAQSINRSVIDAGIASRGVKVRNDNGHDYYAFLRETKCQALILEGGFMDGKEDFALLQTQMYRDRLVCAYADGILDILGGMRNVQMTPVGVVSEKEPEKKKTYCVQIGAFAVRKNAEDLVRQMKLEGRDAFIVEK